MSFYYINLETIGKYENVRWNNLGKKYAGLMSFRYININGFL